MKVAFKISCVRIQAGCPALSLTTSALFGQGGQTTGVVCAAQPVAGVVTQSPNPTPVGVLVDGAGAQAAW